MTGPVNLTADSVLTGSDISFSSTVGGGQNLTVTGSGTATFSGIGKPFKPYLERGRDNSDKYNSCNNNRNTGIQQ